MLRRIQPIHRQALWSLALALSAGLLACSQSDFGRPMSGEDWDRPGDGARDAHPEIVCDTNRDCGAAEMCVDGICQMARCDDAYNSRPPMRSGKRFFLDRELVVADGSGSVAGLSPEASFMHATSWQASGGVTDVAAGQFSEDAPESLVVVRAGSKTVELLGAAGSSSISLSYPPAAVAAGDIDGDGRDEAIVLGQFGNVSICDMGSGECESYDDIEGDGLDITSGDVDADGFAETILLLGNGDERRLHVWNHDRETTGQQDFWVDGIDPYLMAIDAGDFDGDGIVEVAGISRDHNFSLSNGKLFIFAIQGSTVTVAQEREIHDSSLDVAAGDFDADKHDDVVILRENDRVELFRPSKKTLALVSEGVHGIGGVSGARRVATSDVDGDSPRVRLMNESGELLPGPIVPLVAIHFPPYDAERSSGKSSAFIGDAENQGKTLDDTITMRVKAEIGVEAKLPLSLGASLTTSIGREVTRTNSTTTTYSIGRRTIAEPTPEMQGYDEGLMLLTCACYHVYRYELQDPKQRLGLDLQETQFVVALPVGGSFSAWSSDRYNQVAETLGGLPIMEIPYEVGNPRSYPKGPQRADGSPIPQADVVFDSVPSLLVGDVGAVGWWLTREEVEATTEAVSHSWDVSGSLKLGPFKFGGGTGSTQTSGYTITASHQTIFGGSVPPILDDPATPEDEYLEYAFSFAPFVYVDHYTDANGQEAAYYVSSFAVGDKL